MIGTALMRSPDKHRRIVAWESRPGSGEVGPDGRQAGEIPLDDLLYDSFRFNLYGFSVCSRTREQFLGSYPTACRRLAAGFRCSLFDAVPTAEGRGPERCSRYGGAD